MNMGKAYSTNLIVPQEYVGGDSFVPEECLPLPFLGTNISYPPFQPALLKVLLFPR